MEPQNRWRFYNHAVIPIRAEKDRFEEGLSYSKIVKEWKNTTGEKRHPLFCLYPTDFDCGYDTAWWYNIKDTEYEVETLTSKKRYEIKKGLKNFHTEIINPKEYIDEIFDVYKESFLAYPEKYRPVANYEAIKQQAYNDSWKWIGAFSNETEKLCGFIIVIERNCLDGFKIINLSSQKTVPAFEKLNVNFALLDYFLNYYNTELKEKKVVITNGLRNLSHETQFNEFLEKYFGFRKAYCYLNIKFHPMINPFANILYVCTPPRWKNADFRTENRFLYKISLILKYMKIAKECKKQCRINSKS